MPFAPLPGRSLAVEVNTLRAIRDRGGAQEFVKPQRPEFDLIVHVTQGRARHEVDFTRHWLTAGDVMWVHAGQVQRWGRIADIEGRIVLVAPTAFDPPTLLLLEHLGARNHTWWRGVAKPGSDIDTAFAQLTATAARLRAATHGDESAREAALVHSVLAVAFELLADATIAVRSTGARSELLRAFQSELEEHFADEHSVAGYARRLGYSERTLNRVIRTHARMSAKEFIDARVVLEAKRRLVHELTPITLIARDLGFDDPSNFSKYFSQRVGRSPSGFREAAQRRAPSPTSRDTSRSAC